MKYYLIAGEKSGDQHAAKLMQALRTFDPQAQFRGFGGETMQANGLDLQVHYRDMAFMGFWEVFKNLPTISKFLSRCKKDILAWKPDVVLLIDYAGFNLRIAKFAHRKKFRTYYYISPKIWAWNTKRAYGIKRYVDRMFVIMPFEKDFYAQFDYAVDYVGNPLSDHIRDYEPDPEFPTRNHLSKEPLIALLPGSRAQEVSNMLETMLSVREQFPGYQWFVAGVSSLPETLYEPARKRGVPVLYDQTYDLLSHAHAALVTSGTATLETALFEVPQVVCYKTSFLTYHIAKRLIKAPFISLVNLIAEKEVVKELIHHDFTSERVAEELSKILGEGRKPMLDAYHNLKERIGTENTAHRTAQGIWQYLSADKR